jgi:hypothetical protein
MHHRAPPIEIFKIHTHPHAPTQMKYFRAPIGHFPLALTTIFTTHTRTQIENGPNAHSLGQ